MAFSQVIPFAIGGVSSKAGRKDGGCGRTRRTACENAFDARTQVGTGDQHAGTRKGMYYMSDISSRKGVMVLILKYDR